MMVIVVFVMPVTVIVDGAYHEVCSLGGKVGRAKRMGIYAVLTAVGSIMAWGPMVLGVLVAGAVDEYGLFGSNGWLMALFLIAAPFGAVAGMTITSLVAAKAWKKVFRK